MGAWSYEGVNRAGKKVIAKVEASNEREARKLLRGQGIRVRRLSAPSILEFDLGAWAIDKGFGTPFGAKELMNFTKQLSIMINAGVPILQCLEILHKQQTNIMLKKAIKTITVEVGEGKTLADAMETQVGFDKLFCNLIRAGETGGILDEILDKLADHLEKQEKTKKQIKSALTYPSIVIVVGVVVIYGMMVFVVPQFTDMLADTGQEMPAITKFVIDTSDFLSKYTVYLVPGAIMLLIFLKAWFKTESGKPVFDVLTMNLPIFGGVVIKGNLSSFTRTLATMITSGVSLIDSLTISIDTVENTIISKDLNKMKKAVTEGKTLTEELAKIGYFPDMVTQMIRVGESTGNLDQMLLKIADVFEEEVANLIEQATKLIEPIILVVLGGAVAVILLAMYLPMFMSAGS
jgi:type IV pilus assembly protein PilC